jgi:tetratricopeptide (TPR) repeat protein
MERYLLIPFCAVELVLLVCVVFPIQTEEFRTNKAEKKARRTRKQIDIVTMPTSAPDVVRRSHLLVEMTYEELTGRRKACQMFNNKEGEIKVIEQMLKICPTTDELTKLWMELADLFFELKQFEMAYVTYKNFMTYYPGHTQFEYALYRAIQSAHHRLPSYDRDQSETEKLLELVEMYKQKDFVLYKVEISGIQRQCTELLLLAELYVIEFYLNKGDISVAQSRYVSLMDNSYFITVQSEVVRNWHGTLGQRLQGHGVEIPHSPLLHTEGDIHKGVETVVS